MEGNRYFNTGDKDGAKMYKIDKKSYTNYKQIQKSNRQYMIKKAKDKYPGKAPIPDLWLQRHSRGEGVQTDGVRTKLRKKMVARMEARADYASKFAARSDLLLNEEAGFLEGDSDDEFTSNITQVQLRRNVDVESASKGFDLNLQQFGPYTIDYTRNGCHLVLGGRKGHIATIEWLSKKLLCEINVMESVHDVKWLHTETLFAVAQKKWTFIYDNQGIEIHCLKTLNRVLKLEYLPYHFIMAASNEHGWLSWLDISLGKMVAQVNTKMGRLPTMCQNPSNAILCLGHTKGVVTMWTPNLKEPVAKILCHKQPVTAVTVDRSGLYMATGSVDRSLKIWDVRMFRCIQNYMLGGGVSKLEFSHRGLLGVAIGDTVEVYKDCCSQRVKYPYMRHQQFSAVTDMHFAPFEDVMGIGHTRGFTSILVPGCAEANFDALEANPYQTKSQRKEAEVIALLEKIQPELITLDPTKLGEVEMNKLKADEFERSKKLYIKPKDLDLETARQRSKSGKNGTAKRFHIKKTTKDQERHKNLKEISESLKSNDERQGKKPKSKKFKKLTDRLL